MAYLRDIRYGDQLVGTLQTDGWVTWLEIADAAPDALRALHDQRYASQFEAEATVQAVINTLPEAVAATPVVTEPDAPEVVEAPTEEPAAEPDANVVSQSVNAEDTRKSAKKN